MVSQLTGASWEVYNVILSRSTGAGMTVPGYAGAVYATVFILASQSNQIGAAAVSISLLNALFIYYHVGGDDGVNHL